MTRSLSIAAVLILGISALLSAQLPDDFPTLTTRQPGETAEGHVFLAVATEVEGFGYYLILLEDDGTVADYKKLENDYAYDFKMQPNGQLSYAQFLSHHSYTGGGNVIHMITDRNLNIVDSLQMTNGYIAEAHDFQLLPNGHYLAFGYYLTPGVDMRQYLEGAHPSAFVSGGVVQEFDAEKNLVWQWKSWDHYDFADYGFSGGRAKRETVSAFHLNTIGLDHDGHLFLATPGWVKKINRQTGQTVWNLGGDDNDFSFVGVDSTNAVDHFEGHAFYLLENGNYLVYDNGGRRRKDASSEIHEYSLDQENLVATHVWTYARTEDTIGAWHRGNAYRLPNGNTIIGWGGADGDPIPTATEVDPEGNVVWEAFFDNPEIESYRAFRFPLDVDTPFAFDEKESVSPDTYEFIQGDTLHTGVTVQIDDRTGDGYNTLSISRYKTAPMSPAFPGRAPRVKAQRAVMEQFGITSINGQILFDAAEFGIRNPAEVTVYHREFEGQGLFIPLTTTYNPVKGEIAATFDRVGEFILTWPDVEAVSLPPSPFLPRQGELVNQELPIHMEWASDGFFTGFQLQVATDEAFTGLALDTGITHSNVAVFAEAAANTTYYWRVRSKNGAEESEWSDTASFSTSPPMVSVTSPNEAVEWQVGLDYWILWEDNVEEEVVLELHKSDVLDHVIDTAASTGAFLWTIPFDQATGDDYSVVIRSLADESVADQSDVAFALVDTTSTGISGPLSLERSLVVYPNPSTDQVSLRFTLPSAEEVRILLYDLNGRRVESKSPGIQPAGPGEFNFPVNHLEKGFYLMEFRAGKASVHRMVVVR